MPSSGPAQQACGISAFWRALIRLRGLPLITWAMWLGRRELMRSCGATVPLPTWVPSEAPPAKPTASTIINKLSVSLTPQPMASVPLSGVTALCSRLARSPATLQVEPITLTMQGRWLARQKEQVEPDPSFGRKPTAYSPLVLFQAALTVKHSPSTTWDRWLENQEAPSG